MELSERFALILKENNLKQNQLAAMLGVTESYISALLRKRSSSPSQAFVNLIEERLGYSAAWVLTGAEPKLVSKSSTPGLSDMQRRVIFDVEKLPESHLKAVLAFIDSLDKLEDIFREETEREQ